ncbi:G8 domain-containing protein [uncultured Tateyamaria sp.]|uniref:G8 domain-containing protein n=1 Tax=uncultured Tateyamaria sp. TaxID=455651 RepID=UPI00261DD622|nr:G8 domain-containing protein [uncultured Tateyamaria sp.]
MPVTQIENNDAFLMAIGEGSRIEVHGADAEKESWTQLNQSAGRGENVLQLELETGWEVGDRIAIASTGTNMEDAEERTIVEVRDGGRTVVLDQPLVNDHFGDAQTYQNGKSGQDAREWTVDQRAEVALLSRNVTIQGDEDSTQDGFGGHSMVMDGADIHISGAEFARMGQEGALGRYPLHWHLQADVSGQYVENSSIHHSYNKGVTIHGTQNAWLEDNVVFDTIGHGYFLEDGAEFGNVLIDNLAFVQRAADNVRDAPIASDATAVSSFWIQNPDNHLIGNRAVGSDHSGFWVLSREAVIDQSAATGLYDGYVPRDQAFGIFEGNVAHANNQSALRIGGQVDETTGAVSPNTPFHITQRDGQNNAVDYLIQDFEGYKSGGDAVWVRGFGGAFENMILADNGRATFLRGLQTVEDSLIVGASDNDDGSPIRGGERHGISLYDEALAIRDSHFAGFSGTDDGAFSQHIGVDNSTRHSIENVTFENDGTNPFTNRDRQGITDEQGTFSVGLVDIDGSITGTPGQILTPRIDDVGGQFVRVDQPGFNAGEGATYDQSIGAWVNPVGTTIGVLEHTSTSVPMTVTRSDGPQLSNLNADDRTEFLVFADQDLIYTVDHQGAPDSRFSVDVTDLPLGASVVLRYVDLSPNTSIQGADSVDSLDALMQATGSSVFRQGGDTYLKLVATEFDYDSSSGSPAIDQRSFSDSITVVSGGGRDQGDNASEPRDLGRTVPYGTVDADQITRPERAQSTSDTVDIAPDDARWSDASTWAGSLPDVGDIVVVGEGETLVLDTDAEVAGIIVNGGALIVEDTQDIDLVTDYLLVINEGLFQVGQEDSPHQNDFTLTLEGDDPTADINLEPFLNLTGIEIV